MDEDVGKRIPHLTEIAELGGSAVQSNGFPGFQTGLTLRSRREFIGLDQSECPIVVRLKRSTYEQRKKVSRPAAPTGFPRVGYSRASAPRPHRRLQHVRQVRLRPTGGAAGCFSSQRARATGQRGLRRFPHTRRTAEPELWRANAHPGARLPSRHAAHVASPPAANLRACALHPLASPDQQPTAPRPRSRVTTLRRPRTGQFWGARAFRECDSQR